MAKLPSANGLPGARRANIKEVNAHHMIRLSLDIPADQHMHLKVSYQERYVYA